MNAQILIVDHDRRQREDFCALFAAVGLEARGFGSLHEVDAGTRRVAMLESDEGLAQGSGRRSAQATPMGFLLLTNGDIDAAPDARASGTASTFVVKPLDLRALQGICERQAVSADTDPETEVSTEPWVYDAMRWILKAPNGRSVQLSMIEARVVHGLLLRAGEVSTRLEILAFLQRPNVEAQSRNLDVTVSRLRKKVELMCWWKFPINAARGQGYVFNGRCVIVN